MKKIITIIGLVVISSFLMGFKGKGNNTNQRGKYSQNNNFTYITDTEKYNVTEKQIKDLKFMLQEEKLARDVYTKLNEIWNLRVFDNISKSEEQHMQAVIAILEKYDNKTLFDNTTGKFDSIEFTKLYDKLIAEGEETRNAAISVGIKIEELDIKDLKERIVGATPDIEDLYLNLIRGSENHLRAFKRQL